MKFKQILKGEFFMKKLLLGLSLLTVSSMAYSQTQFTCLTKQMESTYIKKMMKVTLTDSKTVTVRTFDSDLREFNGESEGKLLSVKPNGTSVYKGFDSYNMFGDLSEGVADSIYIYISKDVQSGKNGPISLVARGSEVGLEKAGYYCKVK